MNTKNNSHIHTHLSASLKPLRAVMLSLAMATTFSVATAPFTSSVAHAETWQINLQEADLKAFVNEVADITGKDFVTDPRVNGKVTVMSHRPLNRDEVYELFLGVLDVNGVTALPSEGGVTRLVPDNVAKQKGVSVDLRRTSGSSALVTRVIPVKNVKVTDILNVIRPLLPQYANISAVPSVNAIVVSDKASNLNEIEKLVYSLDGGTNDEFDAIPLTYTSPENMLDLIAKLSGIATGSNTSNARLKLVADNNNDRILVKGSEESRAYIRKLIKKLDTKPSRKLSGLKVFKLKYASASHIAQMLRGLINYQSLNSTGATNTLSGTSSLSGNSNNTSASSTSRKSTSVSATSSQSSSKSNSKATQKPFSIIADETQNAIVVNAPASLMQEIKDAIDALDTRRAQVLIQAAIIEVSGNQADQLGVQWVFGGPNNGFGITNFSNVGTNLSTLATAIAAGTSTTGLAAASKALDAVSGVAIGTGHIKTNSQGQARFYGAILQALETSTSANILSMPSIITLDNEQANILVGQNVPFETGSTTNTTGSTTTIERKDVGINLTVVPHIGDNGSIRLEVSQEVSSVENSANLNTKLGLVTNRRFIKTMVLADDQQTIVLGGLMSDEDRKTEYKVPLLGDIPVVGNLFKSKNKNGTKRNLIVFLQPTILHNGSQVSAHSHRAYQQLKFLQLELDSSGNLRKLPF